MKNYIQEGDTLTVTAPAVVKSGELVQVGRIRGVAVTDAASGAQVELRTTGVYLLEKLGQRSVCKRGSAGLRRA
jgi:predicted RecA/RadA family phage recombinase